MLIALTLLACTQAAPNSKMLNLNANAVWLTTDATRVYALLENGEVIQTQGSSITNITKGWSKDAPIQYAHGRLHGISKEGELVVLQANKLSSSAGAKLSLSTGLLALPAGVIATTNSGDVVRLESNGGTWEIVSRATLNALPDAQISFADLEGDNDKEVVVLVAANNSRYTHGILGDSTEATAIVVLERHSLEVLWRYDLSTPFVFEDLTARPIKIGTREELVVVRSSPTGGAALAVLKLNKNKLELRAGQDFKQPNRWLNPIVENGKIYAIHTPHIGGILHQYDPLKLIATTQINGLSNHRIGSRNLEPSLIDDADLIIPSQNHQQLTALTCSKTCSIKNRYELGADYSSNLIQQGNTLVIASANQKMHFWTRF